VTPTSPPNSVTTRRRRASHGRGFTLLELIAASAIMAALALTLYSAMRVGFRARDRVLAAVGPARAGEVAMDLVRRDLESALPPTGLISEAFFGGPGPDLPDSSAVQFYCMGRLPSAVPPAARSRQTLSSDDPTAVGTAVRVELALRPPLTGGGMPVLVRRVWRNALAATEEDPEEEILCRDVTAFHVRYFDGTQWLDDWDSTQFGDTVPMALEVSLELIRPQDPTRPMSEVGAADQANATTYRAKRTFFLPCRNETVLLEGGTQ
jgi:prepilin-type N-terminal cleavage/methylation domain-containing protein